LLPRPPFFTTRPDFVTAALLLATGLPDVVYEASLRFSLRPLLVVISEQISRWILAFPQKA
jgi:hypothetical protein